MTEEEKNDTVPEPLTIGEGQTVADGINTAAPKPEKTEGEGQGQEPPQEDNPEPAPE